MKKESLGKLIVSLSLLVSFVLWTVAVCVVDVRAIGPRGSTVGFAALNGFVHNLTGVHMTLYNITDWLGLVPFAFVAGFGILGLAEWIKRKHIKNVDFDLLALGGFYLVTMAVYVFFEMVVINRRPVLIDGYLEASYPSSTTMLVMCVMPTALMQFNLRIKGKLLKFCVALVIVSFTVFMVAGRFVSGVHWASDIIGGGLLSAGLVMMYSFVCSLKMNYRITN